MENNKEDEVNENGDKPVFWSKYFNGKLNESFRACNFENYQYTYRAFGSKFTYKTYYPHHLMKEETTPTAGLQNPYDPVKEPASYQFWKDKQEKTPLCPTCKCIYPIICSNGWHKVNECAPLSEQKQEGETVERRWYKPMDQSEFFEDTDKVLSLDLWEKAMSECGAETRITNEKVVSNDFNEAIDGFLNSPYRDLYQDHLLLDCMRDAAIFGQQWQSQNTAKQIDQYKARIVELEAEILTLKNK